MEGIFFYKIRFTMKILIPLIVILTIVLTASTSAQSISNEIDSIYNFKPSKLKRQEQESKGVVMDKFWNKIKTDTTKFMPMLREELQTNAHNPFFYFDGSSLLLSLTNNREDTILSIDAIAKCDVKDISRRMFVTIINKFAHQGFDVTKPALKILDEENYHFFIPQHAFDFNQGYCLTYMLLPQNNIRYIDTLIVSFSNLSTSAQKSVITALWFTATCKGAIF